MKRYIGWIPLSLLLLLLIYFIHTNIWISGIVLASAIVFLFFTPKGLLKYISYCLLFVLFLVCVYIGILAFAVADLHKEPEKPVVHLPSDQVVVQSPHHQYEMKIQLMKRKDDEYPDKVWINDEKEKVSYTYPVEVYITSPEDFDIQWVKENQVEITVMRYNAKGLPQAQEKIKKILK
jgi:energy-coupling factor transporter transmembrane protein EcfT